jgi:hypothetical protein
MSIFSRFFGNNDAELQAAQARIAELEANPDVVVETEILEIEVPAEMVTIVAVQFQQKVTSLTADQYSAYAGLTVREFVSQVFPSADLTLISQISVMSSSGGNVVLPLDGVMPSEVPANVSIAQTSGRGE